jgi:3'-phosphoadenosine 5'-phosphosulfate sulfotransferase (PAPS reductase)/FAD synthetase
MAKADRARIDVHRHFRAVYREADAVRSTACSGVATRRKCSKRAARGLAGDVAVVSSFGAESAVLLHLISQHRPAVPVLFLETGKHFPETLAYRDLLVERLGLTNLRNLTPDPACWPRTKAACAGPTIPMAAAKSAR